MYHGCPSLASCFEARAGRCNTHKATKHPNETSIGVLFGEVNEFCAVVVVSLSAFWEDELQGSHQRNLILYQLFVCLVAKCDCFEQLFILFNIDIDLTKHNVYNVSR